MNHVYIVRNLYRALSIYFTYTRQTHCDGSSRTLQYRCNVSLTIKPVLSLLNLSKSLAAGVYVLWITVVTVRKSEIARQTDEWRIHALVVYCRRQWYRHMHVNGRQQCHGLRQVPTLLDAGRASCTDRLQCEAILHVLRTVHHRVTWRPRWADPPAVYKATPYWRAPSHYPSFSMRCAPSLQCQPMSTAIYASRLRRICKICNQLSDLTNQCYNRKRRREPTQQYVTWTFS